MRLRRDQRGQSIQVGAAVLLGFLVIAITVYQAQVVPAQNGDVEFDHSQRVQDQLLEVRNDVVGVVGGGSSGSQTVTLGTTYPPRTIFVNPAPPTGQLRTSQAGQIRIENASAVGEPDSVDSVWDGDGWNRTTRTLTYSPDYHEHGGAPRTILEHGLLYNHHPNGVNQSASGQVLLEDNTITVVTMRGTVTESTSGSVSIRTRAHSTSRNTVSVESTTSDPLGITLPSQRPDHWVSVLADRQAVADGSIAIDRSTAPATVTFELVPDTYTLQMAEVGIGDATAGTPSTRSEYFVSTDLTAPTASFELRDALNNPVANAEVDVTGDVDVDTSTGSDGRVVVDGLDGGESVSLSVVDTGVSRQFTVESSGQGGGGAYDVNWTSEERTYTVGGGDDDIELSMETIPSAAHANVEFAVDDSALVDGTSAWQREMNDDGEYTTSIPIDTDELDDRGGSAPLSVFATSGGSGDRIDVEVQLEGSPTPRAATRLEDLSHRNENQVRYYAAYEFENLGSDYDHTAVAFRNLDEGTTTWENSTAVRGTESFSAGGTTTQEYDVEVIAVDAGGDSIVSRTIHDPSADGQNPADNDDLGDADSPEITSYDVTDESSNSNQVQYQIDWTADSSNLGSVQIDVVSLSPDGGGRDQAVDQPASGSTTLDAYGYSSSAEQQIDFRIQLTVYDSDGVVVDTENVVDTGDGSDP